MSEKGKKSGPKFFGFERERQLVILQQFHAEIMAQKKMHGIIGRTIKSYQEQGIKWITRRMYDHFRHSIQKPTSLLISEVENDSPLDEPLDANMGTRKVGRKQGSSKKAIADARSLQSTMTDVVAKKYHQMRQEQNGMLPKGALDKLIQEVKIQFSAPNTTINKKTIYSRFATGKLVDVKPGHRSPLQEFEPLLVRLFDAAADTGAGI